MSKWCESDSECEDDLPQESSPIVEVPAVVSHSPVERAASVSPAPAPTPSQSRSTPDLAGDNVTACVNGFRDIKHGDEVEAFFSKQGVSVVRANSMKDRSGRITGWVVECSDPSNLQQILNMNGETIDRVSLSTRIFETRPNDRRNNRNNNPRDGGRDNNRDRRNQFNSNEHFDRGVEREHEHRGREFRERREQRQQPEKQQLSPKPSQADIFGGAKPRDEAEYQERRKALLAEKAQREADKLAATTSSLHIEPPADEEETQGQLTGDSRRSRTSKDGKERRPKEFKDKERTQQKRGGSSSPLPDEPEKANAHHNKEHKPQGKNRKDKKDQKKDKEEPVPEEDDEFITVKRDSNKKTTRKAATSPKEQQGSAALSPKDTPVEKKAPKSSNKNTAFAALIDSDDE